MRIGNNPQKQLYDNTEEIELLKQEIAPWWRSTVALNDSDTSIAISSTNAPVETERGFLIDPNGKLFKITAGDGTTLLLEFYSKLTITQESGGDTPATGGDIEIKRDYNIGFGEYIGVLFGDVLQNVSDHTIIVITSSSSQGSLSVSSSAPSSYNGTPSSTQKYDPRFGALEDGGRICYQQGTGHLLTFKSFIDENGNKKYGIISKGTTSASQTPSSVMVSIYTKAQKYIGSVNSTIRVAASIELLCWNTNDNKYDIITIPTTKSSVTSAALFNGYYVYGGSINVTLPNYEILCGILSANSYNETSSGLSGEDYFEDITS